MGEGRFQVADMPDQLTIYVHLPPITTNQESEACRDNTLNAIAARIRRKKKRQNVVIQGDFNIDQLPVQANDPGASIANREAKHFHERHQLRAWAETLGLEARMPELVAGRC